MWCSWFNPIASAKFKVHMWMWQLHKEQHNCKDRVRMNTLVRSPSVPADFECQTPQSWHVDHPTTEITDC